MGLESHVHEILDRDGTYVFGVHYFFENGLVVDETWNRRRDETGADIARILNESGQFSEAAYDAARGKILFNRALIPAATPGRITVSVFDRAAYDADWGSHGVCRPELYVRTVQIADACPVCGSPRGVPEKRRFCQDEAFYYVDCWQNPCGHVDAYPDVLREAKALREAP